MAEEMERKPAHERRYGKDDKKPESKKGPEGRSEVKDGADDKPEDAHKTAREAMMKRHEKEHRDLHGGHITAMRQMMDRHEDEMSAMNQQQGVGQGGPAAGADAEQDEWSVWSKAGASVEYDSFEKYQRGQGADAQESPDFPPNLQFSISDDDLKQAQAAGGEPGDKMRFAAMCTVTSVTRGMDDSRVELEINQFAGEDGKFFELSQPAHICLCGPELEKMELEADCDRGDMLHLIGMVRLERTSDTEYAGAMATLQVVELTFEDESTESRDGG